MNRSTYRLVLLLMFLSLATACSKTPSGSNFSTVSEDDPEMIAAIEKARETLPQFWQVFARPEHGETDFALKVRISDANGVEHFWLIALERKDGKAFGTINNDPEIVANVNIGDRREIPEQDISDWLYIRDGRMHGNHTLKPLFKTMTAEDVKMYKSIMADPES